MGQHGTAGTSRRQIIANLAAFDTQKKIDETLG
jgi:hypothetical protein